MVNVLDEISVSAGSQVFSTNKLRGKGEMHFEITGSLAGTWQVRRSLDAGVTFSPLTDAHGLVEGTVPASGSVEAHGGDVPAGALYEIGLSAYSSGTAECTLRAG